jgi:hypothetical protein
MTALEQASPTRLLDLAPDDGGLERTAEASFDPDY